MQVEYLHRCTGICRLKTDRTLREYFWTVQTEKIAELPYDRRATKYAPMVKMSAEEFLDFPGSCLPSSQTSRINVKHALIRIIIWVSWSNSELSIQMKTMETCIVCLSHQGDAHRKDQDDWEDMHGCSVKNDEMR